MRELELIRRKKVKKSRATTDCDGPSQKLGPGGHGSRGKTKDGRRRKKRELSGKKRSSETRSSVARLVMSLNCHGYEEQLAWLEAYLRDEARDRTVDGE